MLREPRIYFAGPAQHSLCSWMTGHHVLENYENNLGEEGGNIARYRDTFESMALDLGAYMLMTEQRRKGVLSPEAREDRMVAAIQWAVQHGEFYDWVSHYDDVEGGGPGNLVNFARCERAGVPRLMAVFHQGEPLELLEEYCRRTRYIGLGFQRPIQDEAAWLDSCFSRIPSDKWVHGFAMTGYLRWPFTSADSKTWLHEVLALMKTSGQGRSALAYLTQAEMVQIVVKKYQREWKRDRWRGTFGVAAGRGEQVELEELLSEVRNGD